MNDIGDDKAAHSDFNTMREWAAGMWTPFEDVSRMPRRALSPEDTVKRLEAEAEIVDGFREYHYMYDAGNVDRVMDLYADDIVVINPRGTYLGKQAVRENFEFLVAERRFLIHYGTNHMVRFEREFDLAWFTAFFWCVEIPTAKSPTGVGGTYVNRLRRCDDGRWRMFEQRITINFGFNMTPVASALGTAPPPSDPLTSHDIIEQSMIL